MNNSSSNPFLQAYRGSFVGIRQWQDLETFWETLKTKADNNWYIYAIGESVPGSPASSEQLKQFVREIDLLLRREHEEDYCGIVYVDNKNDPQFIKIYDPNNLGVVCGFSDSPPLAGWTITRIPPVELTTATFLPQNRRRWWQRLFSGA